ncbi:hypothetical protein LTS17_006886 [Exophiala oligosperma]
MTGSTLPATDAHVDLRLLNGGSMVANAKTIHHEIDRDQIFRLYDWCFYIYQPDLNRHVLWDVGTEEDCEQKLEPGCTDPSVGHKFDPRFFDRKVSTEKWSELKGPWVPFGPFEKAMDFFGNGSLWVIQAPGHMQGNLCAAARLADGEWVVLGSDCAHTKPLLDGKYDIAEMTRPDGSKWSLHEDVCAAKDTIAKIRSMEVEYGCRVALAHDASWMLQNNEKDRDPVLFGLLGDDFDEHVRGRVARDEPF